MVEQDPYRQPLHDLYVVAGRVFRRKQVVKRSRARHVFDVSFEIAPERIDMNRDRLTRTHPGELGFLEICGYPELVLGQRHEALCGLHALTELCASIADNSVSRCDDACIAEVQARLIEVGLS